MKHLRSALVLIVAFVLGLASQLSLAPAAMAADSSSSIKISINPSEQLLRLIPGERYTESVTVYNAGQLPLDFEVEAVPYQARDEKYEPDFSTQNAYTKIANWITFHSTQFHTEPGQATEVKFNISVPKDVPGGGQYAAIIIRATNTKDEGDSVAIIPQLAAIIHAHILGDALREEGALVDHKLPGFMLGDTFKVVSVFENTGNVDYRVTETITIRDFFTGRDIVVPSSTTDEGYPLGSLTSTVLPGTARVLEMHWPGAPQLGVFRVTHTLNYLNQDQSFEQVVFLCPIWLLVLVIFIIIMIIVGVISIIRNRRLDRPQVF